MAYTGFYFLKNTQAHKLEKFTEKYKIVSGEAKGKGEELEEFFL
ncbi:20094_t:CDS:2 [Entrophospora sp. SA101]|nr:6567_t:CDS:2 [Entrophospora sp. SA101]CAJ0750324.1 20094_t:CDS:2 [Entrophospora sp. SA101]